MDNLPKVPPDENGNNSNPTPPPFGSSFNPHSNPVDPNNPYSSQPQPPQNPIPVLPNLPEHPEHSVHSEVAEHRPRDAHGHFLPYEHPTNPNPNPQTTPLSQPIPTPQQGQAPLNPPPSSGWLPPIIEINQNTKPTDKKDPPLFGFFLTNPVTYLRAFLSKLLKRQQIMKG